MPLYLLLTFYCALILVASLAGGWLPIMLRLTHRRLEIALSFVAGVILGVGLLHLLPHGFHELGSIDETIRWVLFGFLGMFFIERFFAFHHHGPPGELEHKHDHSHGHDHVHVDLPAGAPPLPHSAAHAESGHHHHHAAPHGGRFSWIGAAIGLTLHGVVEGVALAAAVSADRIGAPAATWAGLSTFLAIVLHKPFDSLTILTLMSAGPATAGRRHLVNALYASVVPVGVVAYCLVASRPGVEGAALLGHALSFAAGTFLCIATSDLLPELQFHRHDRFKLSLALLLGIGLAWLLVYFEESGHDHSHPGHSHAIETPHGHDHDRH
jgi:zinc and cadmium transporter